jgi:hypothetical protein
VLPAQNSPRNSSFISSRTAPADPLRKEQARRFLARRGISGQIRAKDLIEARRTHAGLAAAQNSTKPHPAVSLLGQPWVAIGPAQVSTTAYGLVTGRVTSIAADPSDATGNTVYLRTTGGGVWKSVNAAGAPSATVFTPLTDNLPAYSGGSLASLSIGAVSVQPGGTGVILAGTGDPNDALDSYYGAGLLRSGDGGQTWTLIQRSNDLSINALTDYYFLGNAFAGFAWSGSSSGLVVAAVSQSTEGLLVAANDYETAGDTALGILGIYYSTDAGQTWLLATITDGPAQVVQSSLVIPADGGNAVTAVVWNPVRRRFYAAVRFHGYYESADGITWTRLANQPGAGLTTTECPTNPSSVGSPACPIFRGALAVQPATGDLFAWGVDVNLLDQGLWQDVCAATGGQCASGTVEFGRQLSSTALDDGSGAVPLGDYNLWLTAVPAASDTLLFAGAADIFRCSLAGGCAFRNTTNTGTCAAAQVAPFQHAVDSTFAAGLSLMFFGNDSGVWRSTDNVNQTQPVCGSDDANHFQNLNSGLGSLAEVEQLAEDPTDSAILLAGLGANGTAAASTAAQGVWPQVLDGYGSYVAVDPANTRNWYAQSSSGVAIDLCTDGSACGPAQFGTPVVGYPQVGSDAYASPQPSPFILDPAGSANLILGTCHIWLGPADGVAWTAANLLGDLYPGEGPDCAGNALVQSIAATGTLVNPAGNFELIYAGMAGIGFDGPQANAGHLFSASVSASSPIPSSWTDLWPSPVANDARGFNPYDFSISSIVADPHDATGQTVYAAIEAFSTGEYSTGLVYVSTDAGASWANITANLPDAPVNSIAIDPNDANTVYLALDTGVYITTEVATCAMQNCWSVYGAGLPNAPVTQLATFNSGGQSLLRAGTYGRGIWQIPLITAAATSTALTVTPAALTFLPQQLQTQSSTLTVTITNVGTIPFVLKQILINGDFAETDNCATPVAVAGVCEVQVAFTPTIVGARTGTMTIYGNVAGGQVVVPLTGTGIPGGAIVLLPTSMNFGSSSIGVATTPAQNVTISNTGGVSVTLQTPTVTGDFNILANTCSAALAPNFGCTVSISFTPTASGTRAGIFSISDSAGTQTASLSGIGVSPATDTLSATALSFSQQVVGTTSAAQTVTLTNSGDATLSLIGIAVTGDFTAVNGCGASLIGHASCAIAVAYVPKQVGAETGALTVSDIYGRPQTVALTGIGLAPAGVSALPSAVNFSDWGVASSSPAQSVVITDSGGAPLNALAFAITGDFTISANSCPARLAAGANCSAQIVFSPTTPGPRNGTLTVSSSSVSQPFQIALSGNGLSFVFQADGASSATVTSGQTASYLLQVIPSTGSVGTLAFSCSSAPPNSTCTVNPTSVQVAGGVTDSVQVTIATSAASAANAPPDKVAARVALSIVLLPAGVFLWPPFRRRRLLAAASLFVLGLLGCGVTATGGSSTPVKPVGNPGTYAPVITATGPGITKTVSLALVVE